MNFEIVGKFESLVSEYFHAPYAVAVDCCTHGIELCLRLKGYKSITVPTHTYLSIPMLASKLNIELKWKKEKWVDYYYIDDTNIIDAAVLWRENSYIPGTFMVLSFQFKKHLNLGRGGLILTDSFEDANQLRRMSYDGRDVTSNLGWDLQNIYNIGYHYYMTPEVAFKGIEKFYEVKDQKVKNWSWKNYPDISKQLVFSNG